MNNKKLYLLRQAARVERMHTQPVARQQTVGEHTYGALALLDSIVPDASTDLWRAILYHDAAEAISGDMPATAKWRFPHLKRSLDIIEDHIAQEYELDIRLTVAEKTILKYCDTMELAIFAIEEAERGDRNAIRVAYNCIEFIEKQEYINSESASLLDYVSSYLRRIFPDRGVLFNHDGS